MEKRNLTFRKGDGLAIAAVLMLAVLVLALFWPKGQENGAYAEVYLDGALVQRVSLSQEQQLTVTGKYHNTITVRDGKIAVTDSNCPGQDCLHSGWQNAAGRVIVCLPNGMEIRIVSDNGDVDFVVG